MRHATEGHPAYVERLSVPLRWWVQGVMLVATLWLAVVVATPGPVAWGVTVVALLALVAGLRAYGSARVVVDDDQLRAGTAHIDVEHLGVVEALDRDQMRRLAGVGADARAWLLLRPYLHRGVRVEITDPRDPTPYWLIGSRRPQQLAEALRAAASRPG